MQNMSFIWARDCKSALCFRNCEQDIIQFFNFHLFFFYSSSQLSSAPQNTLSLGVVNDMCFLGWQDTSIETSFQRYQHGQACKSRWSFQCMILMKVTWQSLESVRNCSIASPATTPRQGCTPCSVSPWPLEKWLPSPALALKIFKTAAPYPAQPWKCPKFNCYPTPPRGFYFLRRPAPPPKKFLLPRGKKRLPCASPAPALHDRVFKLFNWTQPGKPFSDQQHAVCGQHNSYICVKKMAYSTLNIEDCRNLGAFLGYFLGTIILMNHSTFTWIGQSFGWEYFHKSSSKSKICSYKNLQRKWCNILFGWYFSIC